MLELSLYLSGEEICTGDRVRFDGHNARIEFAAADLSMVALSGCVRAA